MQAAPIVIAVSAWFALATTTGSALGQNLRDAGSHASDTAVGRTLEAPVNTRPLAEKFWLNDDWYENGLLDVPANHDVTSREVAYTNPRDDTEVPAVIFRPKTQGRFPAVLFQHGRRGLDDLVKNLARRIAARGFIVLAPDVYSARFIDIRPIPHMEETEGDVDAGVDFLLGLPDVSTSRLCFVSHTRGGYYTLRVATVFKRQEQHAACYVSYYPHLQNPNLGEPMQVYRYALEIDRLTLPTMFFIGEFDQYQRRRSLETAVRSMKEAKRDVTLITYPGVGRGFDFRPVNVRTFADDLASKDANMRAARFMRKHLKPWEKTAQN